MHLVGTYDGVFRLEVGRDGTAHVLDLEGECMCHVFDDAVCIELVHLEGGGFPTFEETGLQYLVDLKAQTSAFIADDARKFLQHGLVLAHHRV